MRQNEEAQGRWRRRARQARTTRGGPPKDTAFLYHPYVTSPAICSQHEYCASPILLLFLEKSNRHRRRRYSFHERVDARQYLVADGSRPLCKLSGGNFFRAIFPDEGHGVARRNTADAGHINDRHVHGHAPEHFRALAAHQYASFPRQRERVAMPIAHGEHRCRAVAENLFRKTVADPFSFFYFFHFADNRSPRKDGGELCFFLP